MNRGESFISCEDKLVPMYLTIEVQEVPGGTHDLALIFLLLRLRRRTRFFLHLALIFVDGSKLWKGSVIEQR